MGCLSVGVSELPEFVRSVSSSVGGGAGDALGSATSCTIASELIGIPLSVSFSVRVITEGLEGFSLERVANSTRPPKQEHKSINRACFESCDRTYLVP